MSIADIKKTAETKMAKSIEAFKGELQKIRTGRAHPGMLDQVQVDYYGSMVPISQVANVTLLDARTISVQPWEKGMGPKIEKAIRESDLGLNPASQGDLLRVPMPALTEERRKELTKVVRHAGEDAKIAVRNLRRDANEHAEEAAQGQGDLRGRRAPRARRGAEADRPRDRRDRPAGCRQGSRDHGRLSRSR